MGIRILCSKAAEGFYRRERSQRILGNSTWKLWSIDGLRQQADWWPGAKEEGLVMAPGGTDKLDLTWSLVILLLAPGRAPQRVAAWVVPSQCCGVSELL